MNHTLYALIVAAGTGSRMGSERPKQYLKLGGDTPLPRAVEAFTRHPMVAGVCVVIHPEHGEMFDEAMVGLELLPPAIGGVTRQESVRLGLEHLAKLSPAPTHVLVHDGARCFIDPHTISRVAHAVQTHRAVVPVLPVSDTLKRLGSEGLETISRQDLLAAQTPQGFEFQTLLELHRNPATSEATDDVSLAEAAGIPVLHVEGDTRNFKLTTEADWQRALAMIAPLPTEFRSGTGIDAHRFVPFDPPAHGHTIRICGMPVAHSHRIEGHSDGDVGLHALVDAILGALGEGDIGEHFPPSDPQWKGADSSQFVDFAAQRLYMREARIMNIDITLVCEAPKIAPHRLAMVARIADLLQVVPSRISVKATTTEQMGFTGRREGIMAYATATIELPRNPL